MPPPLDDKIRAAEAVLEETLAQAAPEAVRVAWTGGKDSTVVLFIWKALLDSRALGPPRAVNLDTGCKFPDIMAFRDRLTEEWGVDLHVAVPDEQAPGFELAADPVDCCRRLKVEPLKRAVRDTGTSRLVTGIRRDEHPDRADRPVFEPRTDPDHVLVNPILDWTETDIWAFHHRFGLPSCELYGQGYRSLGCRPCTAKPTGASERSGRDPAKERAMGALRDLGYF